MKQRFEPIPDLDECAPVELAARARNLTGMAFFDSSRDMGEDAPLSILAVEPDSWISGNLFEETDFESLQNAVLGVSERNYGCDLGLPGSIVAGSVEYEGHFCFGVYTKVLVFRHREGVWYGAGDWWKKLLQPQSATALLDGPLLFSPRTSEEEFCARVRRAQEYITAGDIYQVNLSHRLEAVWPGGDPWALYEALRHYSPSPYGAYLRQREQSILCSSPELFLKFSGLSVQTRPIKGTRPRRSEIHADERSAFDLLTSPKEVSELVMITDLERSDLGQFCEWGSVEVRELLKLERHAQVFHLVSTVQGLLRKDVDHVSALRACFPGGSITGAPKRRAREIITELEQGPRGSYTGTLGWFGAEGESAFNILIRSVVVNEQKAHFHVGAGIVAESDPLAEWRETWDKAAGILLAADRVHFRAGDAQQTSVSRSELLER